MGLSELENQRTAVHEAHAAFDRAGADVQRLNTETMTAMGNWMDAQLIAEQAYSALTKKQTEHAHALVQLVNAKLELIAVYERVQAELIRKTAQA